MADRVSAKDYSSYWEGLWAGGLQAGQVESVVFASSKTILATKEQPHLHTN